MEERLLEYNVAIPRITDPNQAVRIVRRLLSHPQISVQEVALWVSGDGTQYVRLRQRYSYGTSPLHYSSVHDLVTNAYDG